MSSVASIGWVPVPPSRGGFNRRPGAFLRRHIVVIAVTVVLVVFALAALIVLSLQTLGGLGNAFDGLAAPAAAGEAAHLANSQGIAYGELTLQDLRTHYPTTKWGTTWVPGTESSTSANMVSIDATENHLITAVRVQGTWCDRVLAVQAGDDPIVSSDHLAGAGVFMQNRSAVGQRGSCGASDAPTSGWMQIARRPPS
jgi:hypothetical protein